MGLHMSREDADSVRGAKDQHTQEHLTLGGAATDVDNRKVQTTAA